MKKQKKNPFHWKYNEVLVFFLFAFWNCEWFEWRLRSFFLLREQRNGRECVLADGCCLCGGKPELNRQTNLKIIDIYNLSFINFRIIFEGHFDEYNNKNGSRNE